MNILKGILLIIIVFIFLSPLFFLKKPFNIDDPQFVRTSDIVIDDPRLLINLGIPRNVSGTFFGEVKTGKDIAEPTLHYGLISLLVYFSGKKETTLHFTFYLLALLSIISFIFLLRSFQINNLIISVVLFALPSFFVHINSAMTDIPLLLFFLISLFFLRIGFRDEKIAFFIISGIFATLTWFESYQGLYFIFLALLYGLIFNKFQRSILCLTIPFASLMLWCLVNLHYSGSLAILNALFVKDNLNSLNIFRIIEKLTANITQIGGSTIAFPFLLYIGIEKKKDFLIFIFILIASFMFFSIHDKSINLLNSLMASIFFSSGIIFLISSIKFCVFQEKSKDSYFLIIWLLSFLVAISLLLPFGSARYLLLVTPALVIIYFQQIEKRIANIKLKYLFLILTVFFTWISSIGITYSDYQFANVYYDFSSGLKNKYPHRQIYFTGEWGFKYYMEEEGYKYLLRSSNSSKVDDIIVIPTLPCPSPLHPDLQARLNLIDTVVYNSKFPVRVMNREAHAGFYADGFGFLPYSFSTAPLETFKIYKVFK